MDIAHALTAKDIARVLGMNTAYVRRRFLPEMESVKIGRTNYIPLEAFNRWLDQHKVEPKNSRPLYSGTPVKILNSNVYPILYP